MASMGAGRTVKPWANDELEEDIYSENEEDSEPSTDESDPRAEQDSDEEDSENESTSSAEAGEILGDISFGALAKAQASFSSNPRKRKLAATEEPAAERETYHRLYDEESKREANKSKNTSLSRTSKHAPTVQSSRHPVARRRDIFDPSPALKSRDPRFDVTITTARNDKTASDRANKNYAFLSSYQAAEILDLKAQIKKAKDPKMADELKRQVMSIESKVRSAEANQRENEILKRHKQKEREAIKSGQKDKPYFLKQSEVRKEALVERFNSMGKRARDKAMERKRKRTKGKDSKGMPRARRERDVVEP